MIEYIHFCGPLSNGTRMCCKYCKHFHLWGASAGICDITGSDELTYENACPNFEEIIGEPEYF